MSLDKDMVNVFRRIAAWGTYTEEDKNDIRQAFIDAGWVKPTRGNPDANRIIEAFKEVHNVPSVRETDKKSARVLSEAYGADNVIQIIRIMKDAKWAYKPSINHLKDVETKWIMIGRYLTKNQVTSKESHGF